jgi:hypothetical protein
VICCAPTLAEAGWWDEAGRSRETTVASLRNSDETPDELPLLVQARVLSTRDAAPRAWAPLLLIAPESGRTVRVLVRPGTRAALALRELDAETTYQVHVVARTNAGRRTWEALRFTGPSDPLTPEERGELARAQRFHSLGNPKAAERVYAALLHKRPHEHTQRVELLAALGKARVELRRPQEALVAFLDVLKLDPRHAVAQSAVLRLTEKRTAHGDAPPPTDPLRASGRPSGAVPRPPAPLSDPDLVPVPSAPTLAPAGGRAANSPAGGRTTEPPRKKSVPAGVPPLPATESKSDVPPRPPSKTPDDEEEQPPPAKPALSGPR